MSSVAMADDATSKKDTQVANLAAGFTIGFGFLTVWETIKQTRRNKNPLRSVYIYMLWGEVVANVVIGILGWLFLDGIIGPSIPTLFFFLFAWVFQIQLLMQIIINRIAIIAENRKTIFYLKWGTAGVITCINIAVFCIFIPAHMVPAASATYVHINNYWDRTSKFLICAVDAGLNWYFARIVNQRLVKYHGLVKYKPLVSFTGKLMIVSIAMDFLLIGFMWYPNQVVFLQIHPVTYTVKLNIEMAMANLITRLARGENDQLRDDPIQFNSNSYDKSHKHPAHSYHDGLRSYNQASISSPATKKDMIAHQDWNTLEMGGINCRKDVDIDVEVMEESEIAMPHRRESLPANVRKNMGEEGDELPLKWNAGPISPSSGNRYQNQQGLVKINEERNNGWGSPQTSLSRVSTETRSR